MKFTTVTYPAVELTVEEENELWDNPQKRKEYKIQHWLTCDGNNDILFEGETEYRVIVRPK